MQATVKTIGRKKIRINEINSAIERDQKEFFTLCNNKYEQKIQLIAKNIANHPDKARLIMLSGPSASGKTTSSLKVQQQLKKLGVGAVTISMDDFFKNRDDAPILEDGSKDFESVDALNLDLLKDCLNSLIVDGKASLPRFDFVSGIRHDGVNPVVLHKDQVAIVEGLHALDPRITELLPEGCVYKIYVSVSSDYIGDDGEVVLSARDMRLIRRSVRDFNFRGSSVDHTLSMWDTVCRGEDLWVRPNKKYADITINSAFACGPSLFKDEAEKLFTEVKDDSKYYEKAKQVLEALTHFKPMNTKLMPTSCVLLEFFGGSEYY